jgi:hypothetical protein
MLLHFRIIDQIDQSAYLNQPICACGWSCEIVYVQSQSFFYFSAWIGINHLCQGTKDDNFGGQLLDLWFWDFGKICDSDQGYDVGYGWLVLIIMFYLILRFYYLYFGIVIFAHKFFMLVLCRLNYFNKLV